MDNTLFTLSVLTGDTISHPELCRNIEIKFFTIQGLLYISFRSAFLFFIYQIIRYHPCKDKKTSPKEIPQAGSEQNLNSP